MQEESVAGIYYAGIRIGTDCRLLPGFLAALQLRRGSADNCGALHGETALNGINLSCGEYAVVTMYTRSDSNCRCSFQKTRSGI